MLWHIIKKQEPKKLVYRFQFVGCLIFMFSLNSLQFSYCLFWNEKKKQVGQAKCKVQNFLLTQCVSLVPNCKALIRLGLKFWVWISELLLRTEENLGDLSLHRRAIMTNYDQRNEKAFLWGRTKYIEFPRSQKKTNRCIKPWKEGREQLHGIFSVQTCGNLMPFY